MCVVSTASTMASAGTPPSPTRARTKAMTRSLNNASGEGVIGVLGNAISAMVVGDVFWGRLVDPVRTPVSVAKSWMADSEAHAAAPLTAAAVGRRGGTAVFSEDPNVVIGPSALPGIQPQAAYRAVGIPCAR